MKKIHIATTRPVGDKCIAWALKNMPKDCVLIDEIDECDVFISVMYNKLIDEDYIMERPCFNFHPSILPEYRGSGGFSWSIINEDKFSGITLHEIMGDIDNGDVIQIMDFEIKENDTAEDVYNKGMEVMFELFKFYFVKIVTGDYESHPQDTSCATIYYRHQLKLAQNLTKYVRAFTFEGKDNAFYYDRKGKKHYLKY